MEPTTDDIGIIRSLIPDDAPAFGPTGADYMFTDEEIARYFKVAGGSPVRAAAFAVLAIATSEALISKVIKSQDLQTDGAKVSDALHKKAETLFAQADAVDNAAAGDFFEIIDYGWAPERPELTEWEWRP